MKINIWLGFNCAEFRWIPSGFIQCWHLNENALKYHSQQARLFRKWAVHGAGYQAYSVVMILFSRKMHMFLISSCSQSFPGHPNTRVHLIFPSFQYSFRHGSFYHPSPTITISNIPDAYLKFHGWTSSAEYSHALYLLEFI